MALPPLVWPSEELDVVHLLAIALALLLQHCLRQLPAAPRFRKKVVMLALSGLKTAFEKCNRLFKLGQAVRVRVDVNDITSMICDDAKHEVSVLRANA